MWCSRKGSDWRIEFALLAAAVYFDFHETEPWLMRAGSADTTRDRDTVCPKCNGPVVTA